MSSSWLPLMLSLVAVVMTVVAATHTYHDYIVVGAGPGGLQLGHYLQEKGRDYLILEQGNSTGTFFNSFPRHDKLISINKRNTGKTNAEFNMRHDWNSLLSNDASLLYKHYSREFFPHRATMLTYLRDYRERLNIKVQYNTRAGNVLPLKGDDENGAKFSLTDTDGNLFTCKYLVIATGLSRPNIPTFKGSEYVEGYEDISVDPEDFEGQTVLILGRGNSAFEVADRIYGSTNLIHMIARSRVRLSWATHYVGDLRAVNNGLLDTYQLKSLDGVLEAPVEDVKIVKIKDKLYLDLAIASRNETEGDNFDNFALREGYDRVIRCLGFTFDDAIFTNHTTITRGESRKVKYPVMSPDYQSTDLPGMYYAGTVGHSLDHRISSGGFIHGFRYTARTLHRVLETRNHGALWPCQEGLVVDLVPTILKRINEASGPYQMFNVLGDVITISSDRQRFQLCEEFPARQLHKFVEMTGRDTTEVIVVMLEYGPDFSGPGKDIFRIDRATGEPSEAHKSNFLHPVFYHYKQIPSAEEMEAQPIKHPLPRPDALHHIVEDFLTAWDAPTSHILPLRRFIENIFKQDMREFFLEDCFQMALQHGSAPVQCDQYLTSGQGLAQAQDLFSANINTISA